MNYERPFAQAKTGKKLGLPDADGIAINKSGGHSATSFDDLREKAAAAKPEK